MIIHTVSLQYNVPCSIFDIERYQPVEAYACYFPMNEFVPEQMCIWQLPQSVNRGSIYSSSQNIRELGPVSSICVICVWILPFPLMDCYFKDSLFFTIPQQTKAITYIFVCAYILVVSVSLCHLRWSILELFWSLAEQGKLMEVVLRKLEVTMYWIKHSVSFILQKFCKINKQTKCINKSCTEMLTK